jgi:hypothetical protein
MAQTFKAGRGLDVGTGVIMAAQGTTNGITYKAFRNAYVVLPQENRMMLEMAGTPFIEVEGQLFAVGDDAVDLAFNTHTELHRPMAKGLIHSSDTKARPVLYEIFKSLLGAPVTVNEPCFYSVPADPANATNTTIFHSKLMSEILTELGYKPKPVIEGVAVSYAEAQKDKFTALNVSFGAGMSNVALTYKSLPVFTLSVAMGGDWIDENSAKVTGVPVQDITVLKERGVDLLKRELKAGQEEATPQQLREIDAIVTHYETLIQQVVKEIKDFVESDPSRRVNVPSLPVILSGGTAKAPMFVELFEKIWREQNPPIQIVEFRLADPCQAAVAKGAFFASQLIPI